MSNVSNHIKLTSIYLHGKGRSTRYLAIKFNVSHMTVSRWILEREAIVKLNSDNLSKLLYGFLTYNSIDWFGEGEDKDE